MGNRCRQQSGQQETRETTRLKRRCDVLSMEFLVLGKCPLYNLIYRTTSYSLPVLRSASLFFLASSVSFG
jgi:hypothetical protein